MAAYPAADLLLAWEATVPEELTWTLQQSGEERLFGAAASAAALASAAAQRQLDGRTVALATIGVRATGTLRITRTVAGAATTLLAGATFQDARLLRVETMAAALVPAAAGATVDVACRALLKGRSGSLVAGTVLAFEEGAWSGTDVGMAISAATAAPGLAGGEDAQLEGLGRERGVERQNGDTDASYRDRVRYLPDTVTPRAIVRTVRRVLRRLTGQPHPVVILMEHWAIGAAMDLDPFDEETGPDYQKGNPAGHLDWLSFANCRIWFSIYIEPLAEAADGFTADESPADVLPVDVLDATVYARYHLVWQAIQTAKPAGIGFYLRRTVDWPGDTYPYYDDYYMSYPEEYP